MQNLRNACRRVQRAKTLKRLRVNVSENNSTTDSSLFLLEGEYSCVFFGGKACSGKGFHMKTQAA